MDTSSSSSQRRQRIIFSHLNPESELQLQQADTAPLLAVSPTAGTASASSGASEEIVTYECGTVMPGIATLRINNPPVNALSRETLDSLRRAVDRAQKDAQCRAFVICSAQPGFFVAGADIQEIARMQSAKGAEQDVTANFKKFIDLNNDLLLEIEGGMKPSVAAIDGAALGGGCEIAIACNARVCTPKSSIGLPELKLGIIPGFGGTQRLPRLIGVKKALEMMLTSEPVRGTEALQLGLVDECVPQGGNELLRRACSIALEMAEYKRARKVSMTVNTTLLAQEGGKAANLKILQAAEQQAKKLPHLPQQLACVEAVKAGLEINGNVGLETEKKQFIRVATMPTAKALVHFFFAQRATGKIPGLNSSIKPRKMNKIAVLGGGTMGSGIVVACLEAGYTVILKEVNDKFLQTGVQRVQTVFDQRVARKKITQQQRDELMSRLKPQIDYSGFDQVDLVVEAVLEQLELKQKVFAELNKVCSSRCILASNTSTIDITAIGGSVPKSVQGRIIGMHFFSPAHIMQLLEIITTDAVDQQTLADVVQFAKQIRKTPVVVGNCAGFVVNRVFYPYGESASYLVDHGVDPARIDEALTKIGGMPMGAFRMGDMAGIDIQVAASSVMAKAYADRSYPLRLAQMLVKAGRLGEKVGRGYYRYEQGGKGPQADPDLARFVSDSRAAARQSELNGTNVDLSGLTLEEIVEFILYPVVNEACRVVEERMVKRVSDIDVASCLGMGFPAWRGGVMKYGELQPGGARSVYEKLQSMYERTGGCKLFEPCTYLRQCAQQNKSLYSGDAEILGLRE